MLPSISENWKPGYLSRMFLSNTSGWIKSNDLNQIHDYNDNNLVHDYNDK